MARRSRYREAQARRAEQQRRDNRAVAVTTQLAAFGVALVFLLVIMALLRGPDAFAPLRRFAEPVVFGITGLELMGWGFVLWLAVVFWRRMRK